MSSAAKASPDGSENIASRVGGIQDQIVDKECGYLVSNMDEAKAAIRELLSDDTKRKTMGEKAHQRVAEHFLITREIADYLKLARDLLGKGN